ncbi:MAG: four helix bundle protein [Chloroflexi bacterium]|nr:MAG: four helix bundle protein [Chloroflexota bacterium]
MRHRGREDAVTKRGFEGLRVWQKARALMIAVHRQVVPLLPPEEKWGLAHQIRASSKSVMANIAEGYGRYYYGDVIRFCYNARGSLDETVNHLITAMDLGYIPRSLYTEMRTLADEVRRLLNGYIDFLKRRRQGEDEPGRDLLIRELRVAYEVAEEEAYPSPDPDEAVEEDIPPPPNLDAS